MNETTTAGKTARKFEGVMLALTIKDARILQQALAIVRGEKRMPFSEERINKLYSRIEKQIAKREEPELLQRLEEKERKAEERADTEMEAAMDEEKEQQEKYIEEARVK